MIKRYKNKSHGLIKKIGMLIIAILFFLPGSASADLDSRGKEFWVLFTPNFHNEYRTNGIRAWGDRDSLFVIVTSQYATDFEIFYNDGTGEKSQTYSISQPNSVVELSFDYYDFELKSYNPSGKTGFNDSRSDNEKVTSKYFRVVSDNEISVHTINRAVTSSEAALIYPTHALGLEHIILTYWSDVNDIFNSQQYTPSQFAILATEDDTEVEIVPSAPTRENGLDVQRITLNRGETYLVQANVEDQFGNDLETDLTGSRVNANKPIAVFSGQQRATVPIEMTSSNNPRDCLYEQVPAVDRWGLNALLIPFRQGIGNDLYSDIYRVLAAFDDTKIYIDDVLVKTLKSGEYFEDKLDRVKRIRSNRPILTAAYKKTSSNVGNTDAVGDPLMLFVPPVERFVNELIVTHIFAKGDASNKVEAFEEYYLAIVSKKDETDDVRINDLPITSNRYTIIQRQDIPSTDYEYIIIDVDKHGYYHCKSPGKMGVYAYAYGYAISYGFTGGFESSSQDLNPPFLLSSGKCYERTIIALDSSSYDSELETVYAPTEDLENVQLAFNDPQELVPRITVEARLTDIHYDGAFKIVAVDSNKNETEDFYEIPGFTVKFEGEPEILDTLIIDQEALPNQIECVMFDLNNYGKFFHQVRLIDSKLDRVQGSRTVDPDDLVNLSPGETKGFEICYEFFIGGSYRDTFLLGDDCYQKVVIVNMVVGDDEDPPQITGSSDPCNTTVTLTIQEKSKLDFGIRDYEVLVSENCDINVVKQERLEYILSVKVADPYQDAIYHIRANDFKDNSSEYLDTIPGFTIALNDELDKMIHLEFGELGVGSVYCDSLELRNYGMFDFVLERPYVSENKFFSLTTSEYPLVIRPGETKKIAVCVKLTNVEQENVLDEILMEFNCVGLQVSLGGTAVERKFAGETPCGQALELTLFATPDELVLGEVYPNPAKDQVSSIIGLPEKSSVHIQVYDIHGNLMMDNPAGEYDTGLYEFSNHLGNLPSGTYVYQIIIGGEKHSKTFTITK
jgi:hypothetical protein